MYEARLVDSIVRKVLCELKKNFELVLSKNLVGIDRHVKEVMEVVDSKKSHATLFLGIHGMGGIGKTTLAKAIYNKLSNQFEHRSFIADIRESWKRNGGHYLQNKLIYDILKRENEVRDENEGTNFISSKFEGKKVLLLLDDVDDVVQLKHLASERDWFSSGSMIIITTRNKRILQEFGVDYAYDHKEMDKDQSLILFSKHAFRRDSPPREFDYLAHEVVSITKGLPLSLEVLGSLLCGQKLPFWGDCQYLENTDFLSAFKNLEVLILNSCSRPQQVDSSIGGMKALLRLELRLRDSLTKLPEEIGELKALEQLLLENTPKLSALPESIGSLENLEILNIARSGIEELPDNIGSGIEELPDGIGRLRNLRELRAGGCQKLGGKLSESIGSLQNLEEQVDSSIGDMKDLVRLELRRCCSLTKLLEEIEELPDGIGRLKKLRELDAFDCKNLKGEMPESMGSLENLEILNISRSGIRKLPNDIGRPRRLRHLDASWCRELGGELPESMGSLENLEILDISDAGIKKFPNDIGRLRQLRELRASHCKNLKVEMPESIGSLENLEILDISSSGIRKLPKSIGRPRKLRVLDAAVAKTPEGKMPPNAWGLWRI
ncbi:disease resistance protein RUN1-like [Rhodamnia argentea]|uniref:Disease resistance protein RUN1-like n=1 Tax=Rhodamnia argentea TaxID=178133 RepID=A0ABM3H495_9MYRT|nr:disease resistance protein RUN1-like [Rhodamnia argentea]